MLPSCSAQCFRSPNLPCLMTHAWSTGGAPRASAQRLYGSPCIHTCSFRSKGCCKNRRLGTRHRSDNYSASSALTTWPFKNTVKKLKPNKVYHGPNPPTHQNTEKANQLTAIADAFKTARIAARSQSNCHLNPPTEDRDRETLLFKLCK